ncbi:MAG: hypothetical protein ACRDT2_19190 [Natronosporangium sp.]
MGTRGHVGTVNPDGTVSIRYVHSDATHAYLPHAIARIWWATFDLGTAETAAALLAHDWECLDPSTTAETRHWAGGTAVPGVGIALNPPLTPHPVTGPLEKLVAGLEGQLFLLNPARPGVLLISDGTLSDPDTAPAFDLRVGEHVVIRPGADGGA